MNFDELMRSLHQEYLASLPKKIVLIEEQMKTGNAADLREAFHKLKGTGRTYGLPEVSELSEVVEEICADYPDRAVSAVGQALSLLRDIHSSRVGAKEFALSSDPRFAAIRKLLPI